MEALEQKLAEIHIDPPAPSPKDEQPLLNTKKPDPPETYTSNNSKEKLLIAYAENFQRQFRQLYPDRKPLLLKPPNECGIEKFICTTLRPTQLPYKELYNYDGCSKFVSDYLSYVTLSIPNELPDKLVSSTSVLSHQKGNCFDYSILLASLLIGVGYDAYCVCGYATREVTLLDQSRKICPQLVTMESESTEDDQKQKPKYVVRPPKDLTSKFLKRQEQKERDKVAAEAKKKKEEEEARIAELEKPPPDKYFGLRYHSWVLVLAGKREIAQSFFIEPTTGEPVELKWDQYLGIEALWNHQNYWVNMQDCSEGVKNLVYDLGDATRWEYFFPNVERPILLIPDDEVKLDEDNDEENEKQTNLDHFQLPPSWVEPIVITSKDYETRCPKGKKTLLYHKSKLQKFAPYLNQDGLIERIITYGDTARTNKIEIKEIFANRKDCLVQRTTQDKTGQIVDSFRPGRPRGLKEHNYYGTKSLKVDCRMMSFYSDVRVDGLARRETTSTEMIEHYEGREDRLYYRHVTYKKLEKRFEPADKEKYKHIQIIVEKFHRDPLVSANNDIAQCSYLLDDKKIHVTYHLEENRITQSTREFYLPLNSGEHSQPLSMNPDMTSAYQVDPYVREPKLRVLYETLQDLITKQEASIEAVRKSEQEIDEILSARLQEELSTVLTITIYDVERNETARKHRQELEFKKAEEERRRKEREKDYLAPFLARIGDPSKLTREQKLQVREECCQDLRKRLVDVANIIQTHFEKEADELQKRQLWYKQKQLTITKEEEADYVSYCTEAMFRIHILEQRLNRHKTTAPQKYMELERRLKTDPRLSGI